MMEGSGSIPYLWLMDSDPGDPKTCESGESGFVSATLLEIERFLGPVKWHLANRRVPCGAQNNQDFQGPTPPTWPSNGCCPHQKCYARGPINHRCIGGFMYNSPHWRGLRVHTHTLARDRPRRWKAHERGFRANTAGVGEQVHKGT
jgi:hypothetical protein